ncbi:DUF5666 domain-containing protein [Vibrio alfacsensis]|uniref:DUF5666 domain-containing protein n=1 Tax=Vibrio alfacsensis TaxID=1074311 RepID=UPI002ADDA3D2|nr:DUF5666 domain-containing protein [Vibrio alfacsensis]WQE78386.1 DUF5666 domain-containing protein [Vibrio alfacsensis]
MKKLLLVSAVGLALSGCGGGSGGGNNDNNGGSVTPPVTEPAVASVAGSIEKINGNEITVNGRSFTVESVKFNNTTLPNFTFKQNMTNMMVQVNTAEKASSATVTLEPTMAGLVTYRNGTSFAVNGITLDFAALSDDIDVGDWVFVSSLPTANAGYKVLSVVEIDVEHEYPELEDHYEIEGRIASIEPGTQMFVLGSNIDVYYGDAVSLPAKGLKVGQWVEVEGRNAVDHFAATEVELDGYDIDDAFENSDIEGIVTSVENLHTGEPSFSLNYRGSFATDSSTCYRLDDSSRCDSNLMKNLKQGVEVEVTSKYVAGQRIASIVEFDQPDWDDNDNIWQGNEFECEGIANYDANTETFTMPYCENGADQPIANKTVVIDTQTRFEGVSQQYLDGRRVEVEGVIINGQNIAREVELDN